MTTKLILVGAAYVGSCAVFVTGVCLLLRGIDQKYLERQRPTSKTRPPERS